MDQGPWKILVVDSDEADYVLIRAILAKARPGKNILDWAQTYPDAGKMMQRGVYDVVLIDYDLRIQQNLELGRQSLEEGRQAPMILITTKRGDKFGPERMAAAAGPCLNLAEISPVMLENTIADIIHAERRQEKRLPGEAAYRAILALLDTLPVGIAIFDVQGKLIEGNALGLKLLEAGGRSAPESRSRREFPNGSIIGLADGLISQALSGESFFGRAVTIQLADGSNLQLLASGSPVQDSTGKPIGAAISWIDISERHGPEEAFRAAEKRYLDLIRYAPTGIYEVDFREKRFTSVNDAMCNLSGYSREELLNMSPFDILDEEGKILFGERIRGWMAGEEPQKNVEYKVRAKDGHTIHVVLNVAFTKDAAGKPLGATVIGFDTTKRRQAEEALVQSQNYISRLVETSYEGIWSVDRSGTTTFVNQRAAEILGYTLEELQGSNAFQYLMAGEESAGRETLARIIAGERGRTDSHARRKDGSEVILLTSYSPIFSEAGEFEGALAMFTDITERKRVEQSLQKTSDQLREYSEQLEVRVKERTEELVNLQRRLVDNVEAERLWVSQDLHDGPMQEIYGLVYQISLFSDVTDDPVIQAEMASVMDKLQTINEELRSITRELRPTSLAPFGLETAIRELGERFDLEHPELHISLNLMADAQLLPEHLRLSLFRIYQTALSNIVRHAEALNVCVNFKFDEETVVLEIQDDGKGFEVPERLRTLARHGHFGLAGAAERAEAIGGKLEVESAAGKGTRLRVTAPVETIAAPDRALERLRG